MLPTGMGVPGRLMAITALGELFAPGRTLQAAVLGAGGGRALLRFADGQMLDVAARTPLTPGTWVVLQATAPATPGAPLELKLLRVVQENAGALSEQATSIGEQATSTGQRATSIGEQAASTGEQATSTGEPADVGPPGGFRTVGAAGIYRPALPVVTPGRLQPPGSPAAPAGEPPQGLPEAAAADVVVTLGETPEVIPATENPAPAAGRATASVAATGMPVPAAGTGTIHPGTGTVTGAHTAAAAQGLPEVLVSSPTAPASPVVTTAATPGLPAMWLPIPLPNGRQAWVQLVGDDDGTPRRARGPRAAATPAARIYWESPELGPITATLDLTGGDQQPRLRTHFAAGQEPALRDLQASLPALAAALAHVGFPAADLQARLTPGGPAPVPGSAGGRLDHKA